MNRDTLQGQWNQLKGSVKQKWGKLTDDDLTQIDGVQDRLAGRLQELYGMQREQAEREVQMWLDAQRPAA